MNKEVLKCGRRKTQHGVRRGKQQSGPPLKVVQGKMGWTDNDA